MLQRSHPSSLQLASQRKMPTHTCELLVCVCNVCKTTMAIYSLHFACCRLWSACRGSATLCLPDALQLQELFLEVGLGSAKGEASRRWLCLINGFSSHHVAQVPGLATLDLSDWAVFGELRQRRRCIFASM